MGGQHGAMEYRGPIYGDMQLHAALPLYGPMHEGNFKVGLIIDERANEAQTDAIGAIAPGAAGGLMANLAPLVSEVVGIDRARRPPAWSP